MSEANVNNDSEQKTWFNNLFNKTDKKKSRLYFKHLGYFIPHAVKTFFSNPFEEKKKELDILEKVQSLLEINDNTTEENIEKCKELVHLHRIIENTKARRRLEKWSLKVIAVYLFIVLAIVICNYSSIDIPVPVTMNIEDPVIVAILTTTTVNIIGLGLIVLRGHFLAREDMPGKNSFKKQT